jgi:hypothetical protein
MKWAGHVASMVEKRNPYRILLRDHQEKIILESKFNSLGERGLD